MSSDASLLQAILIVFGAIISIMMIVAILKIPKIARYHRATMLLTAFKAKKDGMNEKLVKDILSEAGETVNFGSDL